MAKAVVRIDGLDKLQKRLNNLNANISKEVRLQVLDSATQIEEDARNSAPQFMRNINQVNEPMDVNIKQFINKTPFNNGFASEVGIESKDNPIPIYIEFGTGSDAARYVPTLPQEVQEAARKFFKNGKGTIAAQPYLIPAFLKESPIFITELKKILKKNV